MGAFGWVQRDVVPNAPDYYMVQYEKTPFAWLVFNADDNGNCKNIYKLAGQDPVSKSFSYDVDGDGKVDILNNLNCKVSNGTVEFYSTSTADITTPPSVPTEDVSLMQNPYIASIEDIITKVNTMKLKPLFSLVGDSAFQDFFNNFPSDSASAFNANWTSLGSSFSALN